MEVRMNYKIFIRVKNRENKKKNSYVELIF